MDADLSKTASIQVAEKRLVTLKNATFDFNDDELMTSLQSGRERSLTKRAKSLLEEIDSMGEVFLEQLIVVRQLDKILSRLGTPSDNETYDNIQTRQEAIDSLKRKAEYVLKEVRVTLREFLVFRLIPD